MVDMDFYDDGGGRGDDFDCCLQLWEIIVKSIALSVRLFNYVLDHKVGLILFEIFQFANIWLFLDSSLPVGILRLLYLPRQALLNNGFIDGNCNWIDMAANALFPEHFCWLHLAHG